MLQGSKAETNVFGYHARAEAFNTTSGRTSWRSQHTKKLCCHRFLSLSDSSHEASYIVLLGLCTSQVCVWILRTDRMVPELFTSPSYRLKARRLR